MVMNSYMRFEEDILRFTQNDQEYAQEAPTDQPEEPEPKSSDKRPTNFKRVKQVEYRFKQKKRLHLLNTSASLIDYSCSQDLHIGTRKNQLNNNTQAGHFGHLNEKDGTKKGTLTPMDPSTSAKQPNANRQPRKLLNNRYQGQQRCLQMIREYAHLHNGLFKIFYTTLNLDEETTEKGKRPVQITFPTCILTLEAQKKKPMPMMMK